MENESNAVNRIQVIGNLTRDVDFRYTSHGTAVANGSVAVNEKYKKGEEEVSTTTYIDFECWKESAEAVSELKKGARVKVVGKIKSHSWEHDGQKRSKLLISAFAVEPQNRPESNGKTEKPNQERKGKSQTVPAADDGDIPF